ncbi:hypothetical protein ACHQM5_026783 [Ranunculus cassubicifolius]
MSHSLLRKICSEIICSCVTLTMLIASHSIATLVMLILARSEQLPNVNITLWFGGYALLLVSNLVLVFTDNLNKHWLECILVSLCWWISGFFFLLSGEHTLKQNAHALYWFAVVHVALPVFFFLVICPCSIVSDEEIEMQPIKTSMNTARSLWFLPFAGVMLYIPQLELFIRIWVVVALLQALFALVLSATAFMDYLHGFVRICKSVNDHLALMWHLGIVFWVGALKVFTPAPDGWWFLQLLVGYYMYFLPFFCVYTGFLHNKEKEGATKSSRCQNLQYVLLRETKS